MGSSAFSFCFVVNYLLITNQEGQQTLSGIYSPDKKLLIADSVHTEEG